MTGGGREDRSAAGAPYRAASAAVLADRMAAALVHHEPGWRLPRLTALARRYCVSAGEVDAAIDELAARHLVRRVPDGQVYRASPAEYLVPLEGVFGLATHVDPMGGRLACEGWHVTRRPPPEDIGRSLGLAPADAAVTVRCLWTVGGEPGALSATYLPGRLVAAAGEPPGGVNGSPLLPWLPEGAGTARPQAVQLEMGPPPPSVARSLRMTAGDRVVSVTVSFADPAAGTPVALTTAMMRPELFRIVLAAPGTVAADRTGGFATAWARPGGRQP